MRTGQVTYHRMPPWGGGIIGEKGVISLILTCALLVGMLPVWAFAAYQRAQPEIWDGTVAESYAGGSGTKSALT